MQKVDVLSCFSNSKLQLAGAPSLLVFPQDILDDENDGVGILFTYSSRKIFTVRIFLRSLVGSSAQVNCVLDKILLDKSLCLTFSVQLLLDKNFLYDFY